MTFGEVVPDATPQQLAAWVIGLAAAAFLANQCLGVLARWRDLRAAPPPPPGTEPITKAEFAAGLAALETRIAAGMAEFKAELVSVRNYARDGVHAMREKSHQQELQLAVLQKALDNGLKYRVEQLEAKCARLEESDRADASRAAVNEKC